MLPWYCDAGHYCNSHSWIVLRQSEGNPAISPEVLRWPVALVTWCGRYQAAPIRWVISVGTGSWETEARSGAGQRFAGPLAELLQCTVVRPPAVCMIECTPPPYLGQAAQSGVQTQCHQRLCLLRYCYAHNRLAKCSFEVNLLIVLLSLPTFATIQNME